MLATVTPARNTDALDRLGASETLRRRRGHIFHPDRRAWSTLPGTTAPGIAGKDALVLVHYRSTTYDYWVTAMDDDGTAFGFLRFHDLPATSAWQVMATREMESLTVNGTTAFVERDLKWTPARAGDVPGIVAVGGA